MHRNLTATALVLAATAACGTAAPPATAVPAADPAATTSVAAAAREPMPVDPNVTIGRLDNGLTYYIEQNAHPEDRAELRLVVNAGSVLEDDDQLGLAHFVEHMAFNGTAHFEKQALVDYIERIGMRFGAHLNAYTSFDETVYMLRVPTDSAELLRTGFQILEDWAHALTFDTTEIRKERGVVIEEWRGRRGAAARMADEVYPVLFRGSPYAARLPIGTRESLETFAPAALRRFYDDWYRPDLMAVVAVGDFDPAEIERLIRTHFDRLPAATDPRPRPVHAVPLRDAPATAIATDEEATRTQVDLLFIQPAGERASVAAFRESLLTSLYARILNERLAELARRPAPPFLGAGAGIGGLIRGSDVFMLRGIVADSGIRRGFEAIATEVERVRRHGFGEAELERAKRRVLREYERAYAERETTESARVASRYIQHFLEADPIPGPGQRLALVQRLLPEVRLDEVERAADAWLRLEDRVVAVNAPEKEGVPIPAGEALLAVLGDVRRADVAAYEETVSDEPLLAASLPEAAIVAESHDPTLGITTWTLANGVRVLLKPTDFKADEVLLSAYSPGGTSLVPDSLFTSALVADRALVAGGVAAFDATELQKKLAGTVLRMDPYVGTYEEGFSGLASPADLETMFQLIYLRATAPRADTAAFEALRAQYAAYYENRGANPVAAFQDTLAVVLSGNHPRSRPLTTAQVDSFDLGDALAVYRDRFADAGDFTFALVGSFTLEGVRPLVQRYLGNLPSAGREETPRDLGIEAPDGVVERVVRRGIEPKSQTQIVFTGPAEPSPAARFTLDALADVLQIRLRERLREDAGGTYGARVSASMSTVPRGRYRFDIAFGSAPERADELAEMAFAEIRSIATEGPTAEELAKVEETAVRARETALRENGFWIREIMNAARNDTPIEGNLDIETRLAELTVDSVRAAAARYLDPERFVRVTLLPEQPTASR